MNESKNVRKNVSMMFTGMVIGASIGVMITLIAYFRGDLLSRIFAYVPAEAGRGRSPIQAIRLVCCFP